MKQTNKQNKAWTQVCTCAHITVTSVVQFWLGTWATCRHAFSAAFVWFCLILLLQLKEIAFFFLNLLPFNFNWHLWTWHLHNVSCHCFRWIVNIFFHYTLLSEPSVNFFLLYCVASSCNLSLTSCVWSLVGVVLWPTLLFPIKTCQVQLRSNNDVEAFQKCMCKLRYNHEIHHLIAYIYIYSVSLAFRLALVLHFPCIFP